MSVFVWQMEVEHIKKSLLKWRLNHLCRRTMITTLEASFWKHSHCWPRHFSQNFVCAKWSSRSATIQYHGISHPHPPHPDTALSCVYFFVVPFKEASLLSLLLSCQSLLCHWYWLTALCVAMVTEQQAAVATPLVLLFLSVTETWNSTFVARLVQATCVLFCVHSAAFASYLCVSVSVFSIHVGTEC